MRRLAFALAILPVVVMGAETGPVADYPSFRSVHEVLDYPPHVGSKVSVFGYPKCRDVTECALHDRVGAVSARLRFDASDLTGDDRLRLIHCYDPDHEQCVAVLYGIASRDRVSAKRIWWRSLAVD